MFDQVDLSLAVKPADGHDAGERVNVIVIRGQRVEYSAMSGKFLPLRCERCGTS
jgi:hypothetical protein